MSSLPDLENLPMDEEMLKANNQAYSDFQYGTGKTNKSRFLVSLILSGLFLVVAIITLVLCLGFRADFYAELDRHNGYMELINYAKEHKICELDGIVTGSKLDEKTGLFAFTYRVEATSLPGGKLDGTSPYVYKNTEILDTYANGTPVKIAVDIQEGGLHDKSKSVNMSYADYNLDTYPPFSKAKTGFITLLVSNTISFAITFIFFGLSMQALYRHNKGEDEPTESVEIVKQNGTRIQK